MFELLIRNNATHFSWINLMRCFMCYQLSMWLVSWLWASNRWQHPRRWAHSEDAVLPWGELQCWVHHSHFQPWTHSLQSVLNDTSLKCRSRLSSQQRDEPKPERQWLEKMLWISWTPTDGQEDGWRDIQSVFSEKGEILYLRSEEINAMQQKA